MFDGRETTRKQNTEKVLLKVQTRNKVHKMNVPCNMSIHEVKNRIKNQLFIQDDFDIFLDNKLVNSYLVEFNYDVGDIRKNKQGDRVIKI